MMDMKPRLRLTEKQLPEVKDWQVGKKYKILLTVEQVEQAKVTVFRGYEVEASDFPMMNENHNEKHKEQKEIEGVFEIVKAEAYEE